LAISSASVVQLHQAAFRIAVRKVHQAHNGEAFPTFTNLLFVTIENVDHEHRRLQSFDVGISNQVFRAA
jgi:hypothetical protein